MTIPKKDDAKIRRSILEAIKTGSYRYTKHAIERMELRKINDRQIIQTLVRGERSTKHDRWIKKFSSWNYSYRLEDKDFCEEPIIVSVNIDVDVLIITVMWDKKRRR